MVLEEDYFEHDFNNVEQTTSENDDIHGIPGLHIVRPEVKPVPSDALQILGKEVITKYGDAEFWRGL